MKRVPSSLRDRSLVVALVLIVAGLLGCRDAGYKEPISKFQSASSVVIASTRLYVTELNKVERDHYIAGRLAERKQIRLDSLEASQVFSREGLKARLDALDQLANYGDLLLRLADEDAPARIRTGSQNLDEAMNRLSRTVMGFPDSADQHLGSAIGAVATIVGEIHGLVKKENLRMHWKRRFVMVRVRSRIFYLQ